MNQLDPWEAILQRKADDQVPSMGPAPQRIEIIGKRPAPWLLGGLLVAGALLLAVALAPRR